MLSLRFLIVSLCLSGVLFTIWNGSYSTYQVQKNLLIDASLEANRVYAKKLAHMTEIFLENAKSQLIISADIIAPFIESNEPDSTELQRELDQIRIMSQGFNSVSILDKNGVVLSISPKKIGLQGRRLGAPILQQLEGNKVQFIGPIIGPTGTALVALSHPILNKAGEHLGNVLGTIYLHENRLLARLLSEHSYMDGSYVYVVSPKKDLIYHPVAERIGEKVTNNTVINRVIEGESGALEVINSKGVAMVSGYSYIKEAGWGVVAQSPRASVLKELDRQLWLVIKQAIPGQIVILVLILLLSYFIAQPLRQLARSTTSRDRGIQIKAWFYEAYLLKKAVRQEIDFLNDKVSRFDEDRKKDALTGLMNRRGMDELVTGLIDQITPFSVIFFDIDFFKKINDAFGHGVGDEVLQALTRIVEKQVKNEGVLIRSGGEEFIVILPNKKPLFAMDLAEKIRMSVEQEVIPQIGNCITISVGVSNWEHTMTQSEVFQRADLAMYESKHSGRNRVTGRFH
ncbi:sensor domain-containing diguanylate cyclase [Marinomonas algicola]|uniref:sensor domain-containing diguanylate cyclase n=1 Tax=Marinomonas algicola TaxID=2773454 RepID=UPI001747F002|nr:sensor domain-containing diguanylate cyclase [Marinomonas algicola]